MVGTRHILGLALDDCGIVATELSFRAGRAEMHATGEFSWDKEFAPENTMELGQSLRRFLREHGFTARRAVVGLAAKWVLAKEVEAPPAAPEALAGILGIQAERVFSMNTDELVFDYCGKTSVSEKSQVLLLAARRQTVAQIKELAEAAALQVQSITVSAFACGCAPSENGSACGYGLYTRPTYCEFWGHSDGSPRFIKHIPLEVNGSLSGYADLLTTTIQRQVLLSSRHNQAPPHHVTTYDACGLSDEALSQLNKRLAPQINLCNGRPGLLSVMPGHLQEAGSVAAAAVALAAVRPESLAVDFLNPRIGEKKAVSHKRILVWAGVAAAVLLVALGVFLAGWQSDRREIATYTEQLKEISEDLAVAQDVVARLTYAESWLSAEPRFLNCLRGLTLAFPEEGSVWATSLAMNESGTGSVVGKASSPESVQDVVDKIRGDQAFADVKTIHIQDAGRGAREKEFAISFVFKGAK